MPEANITELEPQSGLFRYTRNKFTLAGQNSFDTPPSQDQDAFELMSNTLPVVSDHLQRRWGMNPLTLPDITPLRMAEYRVSSGLIRGIVATDGNRATLYNESDFTPLVDPIFTYQNNAKPPRFLTSRSYLYTGNGSDMLKSTGVSGTAQQQNWGIVAPGVQTTPLGPNNAGSAGCLPPSAWGTLGNIISGPSTPPTYATYNLNAQFAGVVATLGLFGFVVAPDVNVSGIQVDIYGLATGNNQGQLQIQLTKNAGGTSATKIAALPSSYGHVTLGGPTDLWGTTWTAADFADFVSGQPTGNGFQCLATPSAPAGSYVPNISFSIDTIVVTIYYPGSFTYAIQNGGNITIQNGRRYAIVFKNGDNNGTSDLSAVTPSTGPLTSKQVVLNNLPISPDPQVTQKVLLATADGGDISTMYELAIVAANVTTYTDNTPDDTLLLANIWQETDDEGIEHGVSGNTPPPPTNVFCKHKGRVYFLQQSTLWFSKSNDEMLTSTGLLCGRYEESVPGDYQMDISDEAEIGSCLFSDGTILYIATEKQIRRLYGDGPQNFAKPETHFTEVGVLCPELLSTVSVDGRPAGVAWVTPDLKVIGSDFLFYQNIGTPVQNILDTINVNAIRNVGWSSFIAKGPYQFYVLAVPTGTSDVIDTILIYDFTRKKWHMWVLPAGVVVQSILRNITVTGTPRLLLGGFYQDSTVPDIWELSPNMVIDQITNSVSQLITAQIRTTWQHFEDQNLRKDFDEIEVFTKDPNLTLTMEAASNDDEFDTPTVVLNNMTLSKSAFGEYKWYLAGRPTVDRLYRFTFTSTFADRSFTDGYRMDVIPEHRF